MNAPAAAVPVLREEPRAEIAVPSLADLPEAAPPRMQRAIEEMPRVSRAIEESPRLSRGLEETQRVSRGLEEAQRVSRGLEETSRVAREIEETPRIPRAVDEAAARREQEMMNELRSMKGLIEERFGALAFMEKLQRQPAQARLTQKLLDCGFSPALIRKLAESLPDGTGDEAAWSAGVLERNLMTGEAEAALEDQGGVYALVGSTGVGKTTSTAKLAAAFATKYGATNLGLVTLDAYRVGAHEQLRTYGRILGVPVHTAHDRASLEDLLDLLSAKKMVLIDTAGIAQRDSRTRELLDMLSHRAIRKLVVVNAAQQGETIEDVLIAYRASLARGVILSKMDEAVKLAPALDALIRHRVPVVGVANGQRVPEDWHRLSSHALVHRALRPIASTAYRLDASDMNLIFAAPQDRAALHA
jgi:flagellar biosynthesis protein FlhF